MSDKIKVAEKEFVEILEESKDISAAYKAADQWMDSGKFADIDECCSVCTIPWGNPPFKRKPSAASCCGDCTYKLWEEHQTKNPDAPFLDPLRRTPFFICSCGEPISTLSGCTDFGLFEHLTTKRVKNTRFPSLEDLLKSAESMSSCTGDVEVFKQHAKKYGW